MLLLCSVTATIGSIDVLGVNGIGQTTMVTSGATPTNYDESLVDFCLELNPLQRDNMDLVVKATIKPLKIIYNEVGVVY